jgi:hypothetical protein
VSISRKHFVATAALGAAGMALESPGPAGAAEQPRIHLHVVRPSEYDHARMQHTIAVNKPHKQVFQSVNPLLAAGVASLYLHMQNALNAFEFSHQMGRGSLATLAVLTGRSIAFALRDEMWAKYGLGTAFNLAPSNVYYRAASLRESGDPDDPNGIYHDWSAEAVLHRGGAFMVCHNALTVQAILLASKSGANIDDVLADFMQNILPGFQVVPAGVAATQLALEHGWRPYSLL